MESNPRDRLSSLFQKQDPSGGGGGGGAQVQGNDALRYVAPREPVRQQATQPAAAADAASSASSTIIYNTNVSLYQYDQSARRYVQMGDSSNNNMTVGCVIVGSQVTYSLLLYNASKQHLVVTPCTFATLKLTPQAKNYVNFYDDKQTNWSIKCTSEQQVEELLRQVFLTKIHVEIWSGDRNSITKTNPNVLLKEDLNFVAADNNNNNNNNAVQEGDMVGVEFSCWRIVGNATASPSDIVVKYQPFEKTSGDGKNLRKIRLGEGNERIKALEEGIVGMRKNGKRILLAPPPKTNGQDWYLIQVELVKTKSSSSSSSSSAPRASKRLSMDPQAQVHEAAVHSSRRRQTEGERRSSSSQRPMRDVEDLVVYEEDPKSSAEAELEVKELRLLHRQKQLEIEQKALEQARRKTTRGAGEFASAATSENGLGGGGGGGGMGIGLSTMPTNPSIPGYLGAMAPQATMQNQSIMSMMYPQVSGALGGRPMDVSIADLHAKIDYLIRISPTGTNGSNSNQVGASLNVATDAAAVIRGVERIANENDRLLGQLSSQTQQFVSYEKRCDELTKQIRQLQEDKFQSDSKYQQISTQQMHWQQELANATQSRDATVSQMNRLHAEYQQLLNAFYQKQQNASDHEQQLNALTYERESRVRLEQELKKEVQRRSMLEQELQILKKQQDVAQRLKDSELSSQRHEFETKLALLQTTSTKELETLRQQLSAAQQKADLASHDKHELEAQTAQMSRDMEELVAQNTALTSSNGDLQRQGDALQQSNQQLESALNTNAFAVEEKRLLEQQIELLEAKVAVNLERESTIAATASAAGPPAPSVDDTLMEALKTEMTRLQAQNHQLQTQLETAAGASRDSSSTAELLWNEWTQLVKENANDLFFQFQDIFESQLEETIETKQVLYIIRRILKKNTKQIMARMQQEQQRMGSTTGAGAAVSTGEIEQDEGVQRQSAPPAPPASAPRASAPAVAVAVAATTTTFVADESFSASLPSLPTQETAAAAADVSDKDLDDQEPPPADSEGGSDLTKEVKATGGTKSKSASQDALPEQEESSTSPEDDLLFGASSVAMTSAPRQAAAANANDDDDDADEDNEEDEWSS